MQSLKNSSINLLLNHPHLQVDSSQQLTLLAEPCSWLRFESATACTPFIVEDETTHLEPREVVRRSWQRRRPEEVRVRQWVRHEL